MPKRGGNINLSSYDDIFSTEENRKEAKATENNEIVQEISLGDLFPFRNHPFKVLDNEEMEKTVESVKEFGVLTPAIVRPKETGGYEIVSGHRRHHASHLAGLKTMPCIVRNLDDDAATILMVDANLQRENISPMEKAHAYKMKLEAMKRQAGRPSKNNVSQVGTHLRSDQELANQVGESRNQIQRYIRLTSLIPPLQDMVDNKKLAVNPAVEISYLSEDQQKDLIEAMEYAQATPSLSQAQRLKQMGQNKKCNLVSMCNVMSEEKKSDIDHVVLKNELLSKYFPKTYTPKQMEDTIVNLLEQWQKKKERSKEQSL